MSTDDLAAVTRCVRGDLVAFDDLYQRYVGPIYGYIYRRTFDRAIAEDLTSVTFLKAIERIRSYDPKRGAFGAWLYAIARNVIVDHFRAQHPSTSIEDIWDLAGDENPAADTESRERIETVRAALVDLSASQREVVLLRLWEGLSYAEIAEMLDMTEGNCKVIFHRALKVLKNTMPPSTLALFLLFPNLP